MIFIISGLELWCISMTVLDCNMEKVLLQQKSHFIFLSSVMQLNSLWSEGYRPYLIPELLGLCSTETSEQTRFGCLLFFCPPPFFSSYPFTTIFQRGAIFIDVFISFLWNCNIWRWLQRDAEPYAQPNLYKHCPGWQPFLAHLQLPGNPLFFWSLGRKSSWASLLLGKCNWLYHAPSFACHNYRSLTPLCYL